MADLDNGAHLSTVAGSILQNNTEITRDLDTLPDFLSEESNYSSALDNTFREDLVTAGQSLSAGLHLQSSDDRQKTQGSIFTGRGNISIDVIECSGVQAKGKVRKKTTKKPSISIPLPTTTLGSEAKELSDLLSKKHLKYARTLVHMYVESASSENFSHFTNAIRYIRSDQRVRLPSRSEGFVPLLEGLDSVEEAQHALHLYRKIASHRLRDYHASVVRSLSTNASDSVPNSELETFSFPRLAKRVEEKR
ncbi:hypothetical protein LTR70_007677 [Exophiala xenobiotica]|uniref:RGS domain-containing protein n=1 Tax=Lithohypha guttulata TaxID=1690604 RepID=A0ABR0K321_9EURO|nr:hypothetical protein LTR24_007946 [Lithohypha guttulata]KAK5313373.1 hypothetical protein LTR70_007677 [Exophiala xenobiotica]